MPTYYDSTGKLRILAREIGRGGEGTVYALEETGEFVAKIYHEAVSAEKSRKLVWMKENKNRALLKVAAWVTETLHEAPGGAISGFLMPNVRAKEIHELYSLKSRRVHFPDSNWHFLLHTATNVARAFYSLQRFDHVMGDVNHGNLAVLADGTVKLIDCDSYAIKAGDERYACEVGVATHLAPELQKKNLSETERLSSHDDFGLAVIVFQLLFLGRHPFAGNFLGAEDKTLEDCIREFRFAYGKNASEKKVRQPPGTLSLKEISPQAAALFERAFGEGEVRPAPKEWIEALTDLSENLEQCAFHPGHLFYRKLHFCPWCKIENKTGLTLFPTAAGAQNGFNVYTIENLLKGFGKSERSPARLPSPKYSVAAEPTPAFQEKAARERLIQPAVVGGYFLLLVFIMAVFGIGAVCGTNLLLVLLVIAVLVFRDDRMKGELNACLKKVETQISFIEAEWANHVLQNQENLIFNVRKRIGDYKNLQRSNARSLRAAKLSEAEKETFIERISAERASIEKDILEKIEILETGSENLEEKQKEFNLKNEKLHEAHSQLEANLLALPSVVTANYALIVITILLPIVAFVFVDGHVFTYGNTDYVQDSAYVETTATDYYPDAKTETSAEDENWYFDPATVDQMAVPSTEITDDEIIFMNTTDRKRYAAVLFAQSSKAAARNDFNKAKEKLDLAIRLHYKSQYLTELGIVLHELGSFEESLYTLKDSASLDPDYNVTNIYIGLNYLKLEKFRQAVDTFQDLTSKEGTNIVYYNLGLAYKGLENFEQAKTAFEFSARLAPLDADSKYELGLIYFQLKDSENFNRQYADLLDIDQEKANELLQNTYKLLPKKTKIIRD